MTSYAQTTIHSKNSMMEKMKGEVAGGKIIKGIKLGMSQQTGRKIRNEVFLQDPDFAELAELAEDKKSRRKVNKEPLDNNDSHFRAERLGQDSQNQFESTIFPAIYFKKTTMRNVLKEFVFPAEVKALSPIDERTPLIYQIIANLFNEITFYVFNILVSEHPLTHNFYSFFSDSEIVPFTKCCHTPAYIQIQSSLTGRILCNGENCRHPTLAQFLINYEDGKKIWKDLTYISSAPQKDINMRETIAKSIQTGKFKNFRLNNIVRDTTKDVENFFISTKNTGQEGNKNRKQFDDTFMTNAGAEASIERQNQLGPLSIDDVEEITNPAEKNIDLLKIKVQYMAKRHKTLKKDLAKVIINQSKIFQKKFEMADKIDEILRKTQYSSHNPSFSFPRLVQQIKIREKKPKIFNSASKSMIV